MNIIVKKHYPANRLPEDLREGIPEGSEVEVTVAVQPPRRRIRLDQLVGTGQNVHGTEEEVLRHIAELREDR
jgi:hypothetical protein